MSRLIKLKVFIAVLILSSIFTGCAPEPESNKITIAEQFGLAYLPLQVVKQLKLMEKRLPGIDVSWRQLGNTAAIREAMLSNEVDAGFMAIPPFLIGWDKGMEWKIACGLSSCPVGLVTNRAHINSIEDFSEEDRIALPQPGSVQHILLSMACEKVFGDSHRFDTQLVTLAHPDGMNALLAGKEVAAHFTSPPYLFKELEVEGIHKVLDGKDVMGGDFTFIIGVTTEKFYKNNPEVYRAFIESINEAIGFVNSNPQKTASMLSKAYGIPENELLKYLTWEGMEYDLTVKGINEFAGFMKRNSYISKTPDKISDILWDDTAYEK